MAQFQPVPWWYYLRPPQTRQGSPTRFASRPPVNPLYQANQGIRGAGSLANFLFGGDPSLAGIGPLLGTAGYATMLPLLWGSNASSARKGLGTATNLAGMLNAASQIPGMASYFPAGTSTYLGPLSTALNVGQGALTMAEGNPLGGGIQMGTALASFFLPPPLNIALPFLGSVLGGQLGKTKPKAQRAAEEASDFMRTAKLIDSGLSLVTTREDLDKFYKTAVGKNLPGGGRGLHGLGTWDLSTSAVTAAVEGNYRRAVEPYRKGLEQNIQWTSHMLELAEAGDPMARTALSHRRRAAEQAATRARTGQEQHARQWGQPLQYGFDPFFTFGFDLPNWKKSILPTAWADMPGYSPGGGE